MNGFIWVEKRKIGKMVRIKYLTALRSDSPILFSRGMYITQ
jgi:hypothetical protein